MRMILAIGLLLAAAGTGLAQQPTPKQRFLADNPGYKARAGAFYVAEYLPQSVRAMTSAIRSPAFRDADADRILRGLIGDFLDEWIEAGGPIAPGNHEEVVARMDHEVRKLLGDDRAFDRYLDWRRSSGADNRLAFLLPVQDRRAVDAGRAKPLLPIRVLVADAAADETPAVKRLKSLKFEVSVVAWDRLDPDRVKDIDVIFLATGWGEHALAELEAKKVGFHKFVQRGGGLVASQPNGNCSPALLPYPITFHFSYDANDKSCLNLAHDHFITEDLPDQDMPFPHDGILRIDPRYRVLAKQKSTGAPSLAACPFGDGRVVVLTANETLGANIRLPDEILRRMIVWAAGKEPRGKLD